MINLLIDRVPRIEGELSVLVSQTESDKRVLLRSGQSTFLNKRLENRFPLEAIQLTQMLSERSSVSHAVASVMALEDYLHIFPTEKALRVRQILLDLSAIKSHIYHFYWEILPDYLNSNHFQKYNAEELWFYSEMSPKETDPQDLDTETGVEIVANIPEAAKVIDLLQKSLTLFGGKYPGIMNQIPGGITNFDISRNLMMKVFRHLEFCKRFIEKTWPEDVKRFIQNVPETVKTLEHNSNLISFGSLVIEKNKGLTSNYSEGILLNGKLGPVNELNISETFFETFLNPIEISGGQNQADYDLQKPGARTWIKGARYEDQSMLAGALSRMMVTHLVGGNLEISDNVSQMIEDLEISFESPNCAASRLLAEVFESRIFLKNTFKNLMELHKTADSNRKTYFNFSGNGVGVGRIESPSGSLLHQVFIRDNRIQRYRIVSPMNWNFSPTDEEGNTGAVEDNLNLLLKADQLSPLQVNRIVHSYNAHVLDGTL